MGGWEERRPGRDSARDLERERARSPGALPNNELSPPALPDVARRFRPEEGGGERAAGGREEDDNGRGDFSGRGWGRLEAVLIGGGAR